MGWSVRPTGANDQEAVLATVREAFRNPRRTARPRRASWRAPGRFVPAPRAWTWLQLTVAQSWVTSLALSGDLEGKPALAVAPLCVAPSRQGEGIGSSLMNDLVRRAEAAGWPLVLVLGDPRYYQRFGFKPSGPLRDLLPTSRGRKPSFPGSLPHPVRPFSSRRVHLLLGRIPPLHLREAPAVERDVSVPEGKKLSNRPRSPPVIAPTARRSFPLALCERLPQARSDGRMVDGGPAPGVPRANVGPVVGIGGARCCHWCCGFYWGQGRC